VLHLLTSPRTEGLFARAAIQSGGGLQVDRHLSETRAGRSSLLAEGIAWQAAESTAEQLRALPLSTVLDGEGLSGDIGAVGPVIDGVGVVVDRGAGVVAGRSQRMPVLVGANSYEASVLSAFGTDAAAAVAAAGVTEPVQGLYAGEGWQAQAWGDAAFLAGARLTARAVAAAEEEAYLYHFDYVLARRRGKVPGAGHGVESPFVFNTLDALPMARLLVTDEDRAMARRVHSHWLSFARSGDPAGRVEGYWPAYTSDNDTLLLLGEPVEPRAGFRRAQLDLHEAAWQRRQREL
jgi:para-nitrobenzyl esterase